MERVSIRLCLPLLHERSCAVEVFILAVAQYTSITLLVSTAHMCRVSLEGPVGVK